MKRALGVLSIALLFAAGLALAAPAPTIQTLRWFFKGGVTIGSDTSPITRTVLADVDYDFASATIVCNDSPAVTALGAKVGDPCFVGIGQRDGGVQIVTANSTFSCFSDAVDTGKLRHCAVGTAANPVDAGYVLRFISSQ